tara:strand:+ start:65 stop:802 length:738 start_codon:yes stop_codon:yes gene_type:complete
MKRLLIPLIAALVLPVPAKSEVPESIHKICKDVKDYVGCVKANHSNSFKIDSSRNQNQIAASQEELQRYLDIQADWLCRAREENVEFSKALDITSSTMVDILDKKHGGLVEEIGSQKSSLQQLYKASQIQIFQRALGSCPTEIPTEISKADKRKFEELRLADVQQSCPKGTKYYEYSHGTTFFGAKVGKWKTSGYCLTDGEAAQMEMGVNNFNSRTKQRMLERAIDRLNRPTITCTTYGSTTTCR